ncbi:MAG TPA: cyclic peptide export ABC transporter [Thermoanaerobaculia bacterium]
MWHLRKVLSFLLRLSRGMRLSRLTLALIALTSLAGGFANAALLALIAEALKRAGSPGATLAWSFAGLCLVVPLNRFVSSALLIRLAQRTLSHLRLGLCRMVLATPLRQLETIRDHRILTALTNDIGAITDALGQLPLAMMNSTMVLCALAYLGWLSWKLLLLLCIMLVLGVLVYQIPFSRAMRFFGLARGEANQLMRHLRALTEGTKELKLHRRRREVFMERVESTVESLQRNDFYGGAIALAGSSWSQVLFFVAVGMILFVVPDAEEVNPATMTSYTLVILYLINPLQAVLTAIPSLGRAKVAIEQLDELGFSLTAMALEPEPVGGPEFGAGWHRLELTGVTHAYRDGGEISFACGPVDLTLSHGELVFMAGGNGSGKTTVAKLIVGLYVPDAGMIRVDGVPVVDANRDHYRQLFSTVFQDFYLFDSLLGLEGSAPPERLHEHLARLGLDGKLRIEGGELSTTDLSRGQRKRLALLTAYLEDRPIYLFDEWAADQDPQFKQVFYCQLLPELKARGKTVIVISHDDRYYDMADRLLRLEDGRIVSDEAAGGQDRFGSLSAEDQRTHTGDRR